MSHTDNSSTDWITHRRVLNEILPERGQQYYRQRREVLHRLVSDWRRMGLTRPETDVLHRILNVSLASWPWKYVLMGQSDLTSKLFMVANAVEFRRAISGLRRMGYVNVGKVEQEGRGEWHGVPVRYPVLEVAPEVVDWGVGIYEDCPVTPKTVTGNLKTAKVRGRPCPLNPLLAVEEFLYDGHLPSSLAIPNGPMWSSGLCEIDTVGLCDPHTVLHDPRQVGDSTKPPPIQGFPGLDPPLE